MTNVYRALFVLATVLALGYLWYRQAQKAGANAQELEQTQKAIENVLKGDQAVIRALNDPDIAERLRERYG